MRVPNPGSALFLERVVAEGKGDMSTIALISDAKQRRPSDTDICLNRLSMLLPPQLASKAKYDCLPIHVALFLGRIGQSLYDILPPGNRHDRYLRLSTCLDHTSKVDRKSRI